MNKPHILYHAHCADGFAAATVAWLVFGPEAEYHAVTYGQAPPEIPSGAPAYILDFSYPREVLADPIGEFSGELVVLDHHKTAAAELAQLERRPGLTIRFDLSKSGAVLAWEWFRDEHPESPLFGSVPELLLYVQDRDLWQWALPGSREASAALAARPRVFAEWAELIAQGAFGIAALRNEGAPILRAQAQMVESIVSRQFPETIGGYDVPAINTPVLVSEACERLLELHPDAPFVANVFESGRDDGKREHVWSLRSRPGFDVSEVAKQFPGGGGHAQAAGFTEVLD